MASALQFRCRLRYDSGFALDAAFETGGGVSALFGPSGGGKSTCLALIAGLLRPDAGSITVDGETLVDRAAGAWTPPHRRRIGMVFQEHLLFPHKTVEGNLRYGMGRAGSRRIDFAGLVEALDLGALLARRTAELSGGQRRRVALGRALLSGPRLLMLDEPLEGLDEPLRDRVLEYVREAHRRWEIPMLLVSHDQAMVRRLAERVVVIEAGRVVEQGPTGPTLDSASMRTMAAAPGPVNVLRVEDARTVEGVARGVVGGQRFHLPPGAIAREGAAVYVRCMARDVAIALEDVGGISMRNHLRGVVCELVESGNGERVFVGVDVGQLVWAEVTPSACRELGIVKGRDVVCLIKATAAAAVE